MASFRAVCILAGVACFALLISKPNTAQSNVQESQASSANASPSDTQGPKDSIDAIVHDAVKDGGTVVQCEAHVCRDLQDNQEVGNGRDGYYIVFPKAPDYEKKIKQYQDRVRNWIEQQ